MTVQTRQPRSPTRGRDHARQNTAADAGTGRRRLSPALGAVLGIAAAWYAVSYLVLTQERRFLLPPPHEAFATLGSAQAWSTMLPAFARTAAVALAGLGIAVVLGVAWAVLMSQWALLERVLYPYAVIVQTVPMLALVPLLGIWLGYGPEARIVICVFIALFPMISNTLFGLQSASAEAHDVLTLHRATRWQRLVKLELPAAVPSMFTGLRTSAGLAVIGAIGADFYFQEGTPGIGGLLRVYTQRLQTEELFTAVTLTSLFGVAVFLIFAAADRLVVGRWYGR